MDFQAPSEPNRRLIVSSWLGLGATGVVGSLIPTNLQAQARMVQGQDSVIVRGQTPVISLQTWIDLYGRPTAEVMLNGQGPFRFVVDTGSNTSVLSTRVARRLALPPRPSKIVYGVTGSMSAQFAMLQTIETGRSSSSNLEVAVLDAPAFEALDGILGMDMFKDRRIRFSFSRKTVEFEAPGRRPPRLPVRANIKLRQGLLIEAEGKVGSVRARCVLDTGCDTSIINSALLDAIRSPAVLRRRGSVPPVIVGVTNQEMNGLWVNLPPIELIGLSIRRLTAASADAPVFDLWGLKHTPAMLVGMDILTQVDTLVIDYRRKEVELRMLANLVGGNLTTPTG